MSTRGLRTELGPDLSKEAGLYLEGSKEPYKVLSRGVMG